MDSETYWAQRAEQREQLWNKKAESTIEKELAEYYRQAFNAIEEDIAALYGRFAKDNKLSYSNAVKLLTGSEYRRWRMSMEEYLAEIKDANDPLLTELNTLAMRKRISRLDKLRAETLKELRKLAGRADLNVEKFLGDAYKDNYYKSLYDIGQKASILSSVAEVDSDKLKEVLSAPWSGKNYSQRLWQNTDKLSRLIKQEITDGIHRGTSLQKLASLIRRRMDVGQHEAMRLVRTEMNYAQNHAALDSIRDSGMKYYTFIATLDKRTSAPCRAHDRKTYPVTEAQPGKNMPPLHPNCRSTISGSLKSTGRRKGTRSGRDAEGNRITVPASMVYEDFKKIYIDKSMTMQDWEKTHISRSKLKTHTGMSQLSDIAAAYVPKTELKAQNITTKSNVFTEQEQNYQVEVIGKEFSKQLEQLTPEEKQIITRYTGFGAERINGAIMGKRKLNDSIKEEIRLLDSALAKGIVPEDITVIRKTIPAYMNLFPKGEKITLEKMLSINKAMPINPTFTSTAMKEFNYAGRNVIITLKVPKGYKGALYIRGLAVPRYKNQYEVLFHRNMQYIINSVEYKDGIYYIAAEVINNAG